MKTVLVVGRDWKFRALLRAQLREEGFEARGFESLTDVFPELSSAGTAPAALIFDTADAPQPELDSLASLKAPCPVVVVATADESIAAPQARVLRRPVAIGALVTELRALTAAIP